MKMQKLLDVWWVFVIFVGWAGITGGVVYFVNHDYASAIVAGGGGLVLLLIVFGVFKYTDQ